MKVDKKKNNQSFIKRIFVKMCRKLGYEIVDQNNLFIPTLEKYANQSLSKSNKNSLSIPLGKVKITRKVKDLTIEQIFDYAYIDQLNMDLEIANQGGFEIASPLIDVALDCNETIEDFKATI